MPSLALIRTVEELKQTHGAAGITPLALDEMAWHAPDTHWILTEGEELTARCSLWWTRVPEYPGHRLGIVGHYANRDSASGCRLLAHACEQLNARGCTLAVGPMDGSTWRRYRLVTERGTEPPFFLEPDNPDDASDPFRELGFVPLAEYVSAVNTDLTHEESGVRRTAARLTSQCIQIRALDPAGIGTELRRLYTLASISFHNSFLALPISQAEFIAQYDRLIPFVHPELTLLAEQEDRLVGFLFALPDRLQAERGDAVDAVIIKTVAVLPGRAYAGLGSVLAENCHRIAREQGYTRAIHALMPERGRSVNISCRYAQPFRRYTLFARALQA